MIEEKDIAIQITGLKKRYRLGVIGGGTLRGDLQSWWAKVRHKEDPNKKIGAKTYEKNETFMALDGIDLTVKKGERIGIIGHNGAGKSTLLKLLSRVTGPTEGEIKLDGRISSMLEVGTGFNGELTGRENVYLNGAILGMTKAEVDSKIEKIIDFSEVRQFIDTPVKRYSSGMYVKLAFSVAAHLDSEILIMDEVLAVGDMAFQNKCLNKMNQVSQEEGRTILYVSHNMNTIRQLCERVIVMDHGKIVFDGDVEEAISIYLADESPLQEGATFIDLKERKRPSSILKKALMHSVDLNIKKDCIITRGDELKFTLKWEALEKLDNVRFRMIVRTPNDVSVGLAMSDVIKCKGINELNETELTFKTDLLAAGIYYFSIALFLNDDLGNNVGIDHVSRAFAVRILEDTERADYLARWDPRWWGFIHFPEITADE